MARTKKPSGARHRTWIPNDGRGGINLTGGHGAMRIDKWPSGIHEFRYVFCMPGDDPENAQPYERLDDHNTYESFGAAKRAAAAYCNIGIDWIEVDPDHPDAVSVKIK